MRLGSPARCPTMFIPPGGGGYDDLAKGLFKLSKQGRGSTIEGKKIDKTKTQKTTINQSFQTPGIQVLTCFTPLSAADEPAAASAFCISDEQDMPLSIAPNNSDTARDIHQRLGRPVWHVKETQKQQLVERSQMV
jgi:hypothetical protein